MTIETKNAVNTPAIETKFEVGKTYAAKKTVLFDCQFTMTVIKRTAQFVTFQFGDDEDDIRRRKITCEYGVEKLYIHETNAIDGDFEFSAKNVVEVQADETNEPIEELPTGTIEVDNGAKAFEVVAKYFPNGLKFKDAHRWINGAYEYTFADGKEIFLHASCDRDNTRIETLQVVNTNESGSKRKPLFVIINPPATVAENPATVETPDIFSNETITVGTPAEAMTLIETVANDNFIFNRQTDKHTIRDKNGEWDYATARTFENVNCMSPEFGTFRFTEIITADGKLDHVEFQKGFNIGSKLVKIFIKPATVEVDADEYAISEDAFNYAVECEIENAADAAFEARITAQTLANDDLAARYERAKSQVKCVRYENGYYGWYFKGKNRDEWEYDETKAAACLSRYGLSRMQFGIFHDAEVAVIDTNGYDETAFDALPKLDGLNDIDDDTDEQLTFAQTKAAQIVNSLPELPEFIFAEVTDEKTPRLTLSYEIGELEEGGTRVVEFFTDETSYILDRVAVYRDGNMRPEIYKFDKPDIDTTEFDVAIEESKEDDCARLDICGETLTFEDGHIAEIASLRYGAYFKIRNGRKIFYYRGNRVSKQDFFAHIATEDKAADEHKSIAEFVTRYGGSEIKPAIEMNGNFVAQIHVTLANGRQDSYAATFDTKDASNAFIEDFKTLAGDMKFLATIKRGDFYGEVIYRHGLNGQEFFAPDDKSGKSDVEIVDELTGTRITVLTA